MAGMSAALARVRVSMHVVTTPPNPNGMLTKGTGSPMACPSAGTSTKKRTSISNAKETSAMVVHVSEITASVPLGIA